MLKEATHNTQSLFSPEYKPYYPPPSIFKSQEKFQVQYTKEGIHQSSVTILKIMTKSLKIPQEYRACPLLQLFYETCKEFLLSELEIIMWSLILEKTVWVRQTHPLQILFLYSAFCAKSCMNFTEDLETLKLYISYKYKGFFNGYSRWSADNFDKLFIPLREFNSYLKKLTSFPVTDMTNYNFYVDEILFSAPPNLAESEIELVFDEEVEIKLPELLNLNSVFENESFMLPVLENWVSQEMVRDLDKIEM